MKKFIRDQDHRIFVTEDNWSTFEVFTEEAQEAKEERNSDIITSIKIRYQYPENIAKIILKEWDTIREKFSLPSKDGYGTPFEIFAIAVLYNLDYQEVYDNYIVQGNEDGKIDAIYWNSDKCVLYQIKLGMIDYDVKSIMKSHHLQYLREQTISENDTQDLTTFYEKHWNDIKEKDHEIKTISQNDQIAGNINPDQIIQLFFENKIINHENKLCLSLQVPYLENNGIPTFLLAKGKNQVYTYFENAQKFIQEILDCSGIKNKENLHKYFQDNVRGYAGLNQNMVQTIKETPKNFVKYNNGITITGAVTYKKESGILEIKNPIISNGQQTIWNLVNTNESLEEVELLIIVKNDTIPTIKDKIARFTNEQRNIKPIDLYSLDENVRKIQAEIYHDTSLTEKVFLETNSTGEKQYTKLLKQLYKKEAIVPLSEFCRLYFVTEDKKLGSWKSNISDQMRELLNKSPEYQLSKALKICETIKNWKEYMKNFQDPDKNDMKVADLAIMYLMAKEELDIKKAIELIRTINEKYYYQIPKELRKSKLIDLYKSNEILVYIELERANLLEPVAM